MSTSAASAVEENSDTAPVPLAASGCQKRGKWRPVKISQDHLIMAGGFHAKLEVIPVMRIQIGTAEHRFVEMNKNGHWFVKGVGGAQAVKGDLKAVQVIKAVRIQYNIACGCPQDPMDADSVADGKARDADSDEDPMDDLDDVLTPTTKAKAKGQARTKRRHGLVLDFPMPKRPPCTATDQNETYVISVYKGSLNQKGHSSGQGKYYLRSDCLDWLLSYAADELHFQGVVRVIIPGEQRTNKANCTTVEDVHLQWNFGAKAWEAEFISGPFVGTTRCFHVVDLTPWRWARMMGQPFVDKDQSRTRALPQKNVAKNFITLWCQAIASGRADEFEKTWRLGESDLVTSAKKRSGAGGDSTAVAEESATED
jgi:hypothetical protein